MGYRRLEQVLVYDHLPDGSDPTYDWNEAKDTWYLGLAGELASEVKIHQITLPMLSVKDYDWKKELSKALMEAASLRPQKHVDDFAHACREFSKEMFKNGVTDGENQQMAIWFANKKTRKALRDQVEYDEHGHYKNYHYDVDRCSLELNLPNKVIALVPQSNHLGCLSINDRFFNFFFFQEDIHLYYLKELKIGKLMIDGKEVTPTHNVALG